MKWSPHLCSSRRIRCISPAKIIFDKHSIGLILMQCSVIMIFIIFRSSAERKLTRVVMSNDVNDLELRVPNLGRKWSTIITRFLFVRLCCIRKLRIGLDGNLSISAGFGFYRHSVFLGSFLMKKKMYSKSSR